MLGVTIALFPGSPLRSNEVRRVRGPGNGAIGIQ